MPDGNKPDIFDQITSKKGDVFDQVQPDTSAQPVIPSTPPVAPLPKVDMQPSWFGGIYPTKEQDQYIKERMPLVPGRVAAIRKGALELGGAALGSGAVSGSGLLPNILKIAGAGAGATVGNTAGQVISGQKPNAGEAAKAGGVFAAGEGVGLTGMSAAGKFGRWLAASKSMGAQLLQQAAAKAGDAPVILSPETDAIIERITEQGKLGGTIPKVISDLLERVGPTTKTAAEAEPGPLTYREARILQGNAGELSADEKMKLKGQLRFLIPQFARSFSQDVQAAADRAGVGVEHALGMQQYAIASSRNAALANTGKAAAKAAVPAAGGAVAYELLRKLGIIR